MIIRATGKDGQKRRGQGFRSGSGSGSASGLASKHHLQESYDRLNCTTVIDHRGTCHCILPFSTATSIVLARTRSLLSKSFASFTLSDVRIIAFARAYSAPRLTVNGTASAPTLISLRYTSPRP